MVETGSLHDAFVDQLRDAYDAKRQLLKALPKLARAASAVELEAAFEAQLEQTRTHIERLDQVFDVLHVRASGRHCVGMAGILEEALNVVPEPLDDATRDACLIAAAQRAMHYAIASDGVLTAWALMLQQIEAAELLQETLSEQKATDAMLGTLAEHGINAMAAGASRRPVVLGKAPAPMPIDPVLHGGIRLLA